MWMAVLGRISAGRAGPAEVPFTGRDEGSKLHDDFQVYSPGTC
jgi:hypothetical protein